MNWQFWAVPQGRCVFKRWFQYQVQEDMNTLYKVTNANKLVQNINYFSPHHIKKKKKNLPAWSIAEDIVV